MPKTIWNRLAAVWTRVCGGACGPGLASKFRFGHRSLTFWQTAGFTLSTNGPSEILVPFYEPQTDCKVARLQIANEYLQTFACRPQSAGELVRHRPCDQGQMGLPLGGRDTRNTTEISMDLIQDGRWSRNDRKKNA